jgi:hypothetical protein
MYLPFYADEREDGGRAVEKKALSFLEKSAK